MVKQAEHKVLTKNIGVLSMEQTVFRDDNPLPPPDTLRKYKELDEDIVPWLLVHAELEQKNRHADSDTRTRLLAQSIKTDSTALYLIWSALIAAFATCVLLAYLGQDIASVISGVSGIISSIALSIRYNRK